MAKKVEATPSPILIGKVGLSPHDSQGHHDYPTLMQLLQPRYDDERQLTREPGSIRVSIDGSLYRISLECPTEGVQTMFATDTISEMLLQLEEHCNSSKSVWTPTWNAKKRARRGLDRSLE